MIYAAPRWLPGGHLQTIFPSQFIRTPKVTYRRERWNAPDGDFVDLDFVDGDAGQPFLVLFHGLEGSSKSHYARALMAHVASLGWSGAVAHFRSCSGELNHGPRFYHSGDVDEIDWILRRLKPYADDRQARRFYVVGASLGGNGLLRWLGESQHQADFVDAACTVSAPHCLLAGGAAISHGFNRIYTHVFLRTMKPKCLQKLKQFPGLFDGEAIRRVRTLYEFDNLVTAPLHGYRDAGDYWDRASAKHVLDAITVETLVINAQNDPFLPPHHLPKTASPSVTLDYPKEGGHVGFAVGSVPGKIDWLPQRIVRFLEGESH